MTEHQKELIAKIRDKAAPIADRSMAKVSRSVGSVVAYMRSVVGRMSVKERLLALFAVGLVIGFGVKTVATGSLTIGYQDYALKGTSRAYDLNEIEKSVAAKAQSGPSESDQASTPSGGMCQ